MRSAILSQLASLGLPELLERSAGGADRMERTLSLRPDDRVVVSLENGLAHLELLFACWRLGVQVVAVPPTMSRTTFETIVHDRSIRAVVLDAGNERLRAAAEGSSWIEPLPGSAAIVSRLCRDVRPEGSPPRRPDALALSWPDWLAVQPPALFYTSGSTSTARGVALSWSGILDKGRAVLRYYGCERGDRVMPMLPMSHIYGLYPILGALALDIDCVIAPETGAIAELAETFVRSNASVVIAPPSIGEFLFGRRTIAPDMRGALRVLSFGGAATPAAVASRIAGNLPGVRVVLSYGLAETYSTICANDIGETGADVHGVGPLRFGAFGEVRDPVTGRQVPCGEIGELCVGGTITTGYHPHSDDAFTSDGLFRTGDLTRMDEHGRISICGRLKELINAGGLSIAPSEVEEVVNSHPAVADCGVFGELAGSVELIHAAVVLRGNDPGLLDHLREHCRSQLSGKLVPRRFIVVDRIPRGSLGKIQRSQLREMCLGR